MKLTYKGKSAIITGACGGMGLETTKKLISNNINTLMLDIKNCLLYTSPSPRDGLLSRMPSSA